VTIPLDLTSTRWAELDAYSGNASDVPDLLRRFAERPDAQAFYDLRVRLTGDGDIAVSNAFYAALPHIVGVLGRVQPRPREEILSHLGWAAALAASKVPSADIQAAYRVALLQMREMAADALFRGDNPEFRHYLLATIAVACGDPVAALALVHLDDCLCCPRCGNIIDCPSCNLPLDGVTLFGRGTVRESG
jgi:hypothetical protein